MHKPFMIGLVVLTLLVSLLPASVRGASEIRVDDDGVECPHADAQTIQEGIALAGVGGTVRVCAGTYTGGIFITTAGLKLKARGAVHITQPAGAQLTGIGVQANDVEIRGFEISGFNNLPSSAKYAIGIFFVSGTVVKGNTIHDNTFSIFANGASKLRIEANDVHHNDVGIVLANVSSSIVKKNTSHENVFGQGGEGMVLCGASSGNKVFDNTLLNNGGVGILLSACDGATPAGNRIEKNRMRDNGLFDASDVTQGDGTAGTANRWRRNDCVTDSPDGLCQDDEGD